MKTRGLAAAVARARGAPGMPDREAGARDARGERDPGREVGLLPDGRGGQNSIEISLLFGNGDAIKSWKVDVSSSGTVQKTWTGDAKYLPASLTWDGKDRFRLDGSGRHLHGEALHRLRVEVPVRHPRKAGASCWTSRRRRAPSPSTRASSPRGRTGSTGPVTLTINASSALAHMDSWSLDVFDAAGGVVKNWSGQWPNASGHVGRLVDERRIRARPARSYTAVATVRDEYGNSAKLKTDVAVAALDAAVQAMPAVAPVQAAPAEAR